MSGVLLLTSVWGVDYGYQAGYQQPYYGYQQQPQYAWSEPFYMQDGQGNVYSAGNLMDPYGNVYQSSCWDENNAEYALIPDRHQPGVFGIQLQVNAYSRQFVPLELVPAESGMDAMDYSETPSNEEFHNVFGGFQMQEEPISTLRDEEKNQYKVTGKTCTDAWGKTYKLQTNAQGQYYIQSRVCGRNGKTFTQKTVLTKVGSNTPQKETMETACSVTQSQAKPSEWVSTMRYLEHIAGNGAFYQKSKDVLTGFKTLDGIETKQHDDGFKVEEKGDYYIVSTAIAHPEEPKYRVQPGDSDEHYGLSATTTVYAGQK